MLHRLVALAFPQGRQFRVTGDHIVIRGLGGEEGQQHRPPLVRLHYAGEVIGIGQDAAGFLWEQTGEEGVKVLLGLAGGIVYVVIGCVAGLNGY